MEPVIPSGTGKCLLAAQSTWLGKTFQPDWIVGLGGGSAMDAAKAMWVLYERPDLQPDEISPMMELNIGKLAKLIAIPTTAGTGSEATWATVLTDKRDGRKLSLGSRETM